MLPRVVHVAPNLFGDTFGGAERYALELSRAMAKRVPTTLVTFGPKSRRERSGELNIEVLRNWIDFRRFRFDPLNPCLTRYLRRADIIHCHQHTMMSSMALLYARAAHKPIFSTDLGGGGYGLHRIVNVTRWYSGHLHISEFSRTNFGHRELPGARVVFGGVDPERFSPDHTVARSGAVLYVGRLLPHKGVNYLIQAMAAKTPLTIIGQPFPHAQRFQEDLLRLAEGKRVTFIKRCGDREIIEAYRRALCIVLPSVHTTVYGEYHPIPELLGQTLLEGMACGSPAICTNVTSLPEIVEDGVTGFVVPPNDSGALRDRIEWLRDHPSQARQMGLMARSRVVEKFSWQAAVSRCLEAYGIARQTAALSGPQLHPTATEARCG